MTTTDTATGGQSRGRPVLGALSGLLFGLFIALDLILLGMIPLASILLLILPILGLLGGLALGRLAPVGR